MKNQRRLAGPRTLFGLSRWDQIWMLSDRQWARSCRTAMRLAVISVNPVVRGRDAIELLRVSLARPSIHSERDRVATRCVATASDVPALDPRVHAPGPDEVTNGLDAPAMEAGGLALGIMPTRSTVLF